MRKRLVTAAASVAVSLVSMAVHAAGEGGVPPAYQQLLQEGADYSSARAAGPEVEVVRLRQEIRALQTRITELEQITADRDRAYRGEIADYQRKTDTRIAQLDSQLRSTVHELKTAINGAADRLVVAARERLMVSMGTEWTQLKADIVAAVDQRYSAVIDAVRRGRTSEVTREAAAMRIVFDAAETELTKICGFQPSFETAMYVRIACAGVA